MLNDYQRETLQEIIVMLGALLREEENENLRRQFQIVKTTESKKEMPKGMRLRSDGLIEYRFTLNGVRRSVYGHTVEECRKARRTAKKNATPSQAGRQPENSAILSNFHEFASYYFEKYRKRKVAKETFENDMSRYNTHIHPRFGSMSLQGVTPSQCQDLLDELSAKGMTKTSNEVYSLLNGIFKMAIAHGLITQNPLAVVIVERHERTHGTPLTKYEKKILLTGTAGTRYQVLFAVALYTGLRPNEYSTAKIEGSFIVARNSKRKGKKIEWKRIPISPMLAPYLEGVTALNFAHVNHMRERLKAVLPNHKLYDLRTTFYTRCDECGVAEPARDEFVGHSRGMLADTYSRLSDEYLLQEGAKLIW